MSRVVNGNPTVAPAIREKVLATIASLGWKPNAVAQSMRTASTNTIGCVFSDIRNPLYSWIIKSAEETLAAQGYTLMVASSNGSTAREIELIELFVRRRIDGLILSLTNDTMPEVAEAIADANVPTVLVERDLPLNVGVVGTDHRGGIKQATEFLMALGHRRIALITGGSMNRAGRERTAGFKEAYAAAGLPLDPTLLRLESLEESYAFRETQTLMCLPEPPTAIIAAGNQLLAGVLRAAHLRNIRIPEELSIVSSGDTDLASLATPPVTVLRWDLTAVGQEAGLMVLNRLRLGEAVWPQRIDVPIELIVRQSCCPPRTRPLRGLATTEASTDGAAMAPPAP